EWVHVQLHQQKGMISLSPPTICNSATQGQSVLIHGGTSGIGTTALMLCREIGIEAYAMAGSDDKCDVIAELGATPVNYRTTDFSDFILKQTDGRGVDIILDIMGASYFSRNMRSLGMDGRLVIIGFLGGAFADQVDLQELALKRAVEPAFINTLIG
ncbi:zinc-binding dehydrogenase, partial [Escherichia coli]|uniref:zinc-binding dehydrogenase n=1 Tax=Escherichia coli TaxID=562 RepID=UPI001F4954C2